jgi:hypothetical protein
MDEHVELIAQDDGLLHAQTMRASHRHRRV